LVLAGTHGPLCCFGHSAGPLFSLLRA